MPTITKACALVLMSSLGLASSSCVDNNASLFIRQVQANTRDNECVAMPDAGNVFLSSGLVDASISSGYDAWLLIGNQLISRSDTDRLRPETSRVQLTEAAVEVFDFNGASLGRYSVPTNGFVDATNNAEAGYGVANVNLLDRSILESLGQANWNQTLVARVKVYGVTLGGTDVETDDWEFPIRVCDGCLAANCIEPTSCEDEQGGACRVGQDESPDCRAVGNSMCP